MNNRSLLQSARPTAPSIPPDRSDRTEVRAEDVARIDILQKLLTTLNDPAASASAIAGHIEQYPVLRARIEVRFRQRHAGRDVPRPAAQIAAIGNRELEAVLLQLLEDIVTFHSERSE
jgi:hypothetical protein